jgi:hypothetical protein
LKVIRCGRGLGDSIYLQSVVRHLIEKYGQALEVRSDWPDVFSPLGKMAKVKPFSRTGVDILAHYASRKCRTDTTQFRDCCVNAGIKEQVELRLDWPEPHSELVVHLKSFGKPVVLVQLPRSPMGRTDGFGAEILPDCRVIQRIIDQIKGRCLIVQVGAGECLYKFKGIDVNLANKTTVKELLDVASICDGVLGYCSFILAAAESLNKPCLMVWSRKGLESKDLYIRQITPQKIIEHKTTKFIIDDEQDIEDAAEFLLR